ncbi:hypothetical protein SAMD00019534_124420 [Acytostelium subglobosum LB1]|uniref:hypothetical protein n=1 Tax=Acytostelium subglobosum LB1 TaxID=1410327 RepID=UPI000644E19B|nr:hypothetical protein SAMD00019534_124420 [Acytostelium subglobosum LB1]GAM29266.1 hypothetical protein SAMD00019534_124420 [Acytostelium subglobosum LB1]|eukprot:XP_012747764.1 hypothetical protein SAMD00019534_124420 [Acytostelium subglobosum LB1]
METEWALFPRGPGVGKLMNLATDDSNISLASTYTLGLSLALGISNVYSGRLLANLSQLVHHCSVFCGCQIVASVHDYVCSLLKHWTLLGLLVEATDIGICGSRSLAIMYGKETEASV